MEDTWRAALLEIKKQILSSKTKEDWVEVPHPTADDGSQRQWPQQQWAIAFEIIFCQTPSSLASLRASQDDLLLFVYDETSKRDPQSRIFARRRTANLPEELQWGTGHKHTLIDWRETFILNLVMQTEYTLTVCTCSMNQLGALVSSDSIQLIQRASTPGSGISNHIAKKVHASPSKVLINIDDSKMHHVEEPEVSYPDVCFAVDDFSEAFKSMVLQQPEDCYCVLLHANVEEAWLRALKHADTCSNNQQQQQNVTVFSGYVSHPQLDVAIKERRIDPFKLLFGKDQDPSMILMHGPEKVGSADVAVTSLLKSDDDGAPRGSFLRQASAAVKRLTSGNDDGEEVRALQCALMTLKVPVDALASGILSVFS